MKGVETIYECFNCKDNERKVITNTDCEVCDKYESRYIEYPIEVNKIENSFSLGGGHQEGSIVRVRPCGQEYEGKTFLGIHLGELPIMNHITYDSEKKILNIFPVKNPAIFVPELKKIVYGCESFWSIIETIEDFDNISKEEIENVWYVKLMKSMFKSK